MSGPVPEFSAAFSAADRQKAACPPPFVLLENRLAGSARLYRGPRQILSCGRLDEVAACLDAAETARRGGAHLAGFVAYEAGYAFETRLADLPPPDVPSPGPLVWFGVFDAPDLLSGTEVGDWLLSNARSGHRLGPPHPGLGEDAYCEAVRNLLDLIRAGDIYQANFTFPAYTDFWGDPLSLYAALRLRQPVAHGGLLFTGDAAVVSLSPELFIETDGEVLRTRPMKGTAPAAGGTAEDAAASRALAEDPKSRAENLMIVDLLRNDLSRLCLPGTVRVPQLFTREHYPTFHALTSTVEGRLAEPFDLSTAMAALFPCGSVTGAPKIRAMEIIRGAEPHGRGVYTGAMGSTGPEGGAAFNVAIRTLYIGADRRATAGIGSGIVADSDPQAEYQECLLKARFLGEEATPFDLFETLEWTAAQGFSYLDAHLARMAASAAHFGFAFDGGRAHAALSRAVDNPGAQRCRVRLTLSVNGRFTSRVDGLSAHEKAPPLPCVIARTRVTRGDPFLRHKTTRRDIYEAGLSEARAAGAREALFLNERDEVTEGSFTNVFADFGTGLVTPPVACGLLPGILRAELLGAGRARERIIHAEELARAAALYAGNSVRGLMPIHLLP